MPTTGAPPSSMDLPPERIEAPVVLSDVVTSPRVGVDTQPVADSVHALLDKDSLISSLRAIKGEGSEKEAALWNYHTSIREHFDPSNESLMGAIYCLAQSEDRTKRQFALELLYTKIDTLEAWLKSSGDSSRNNTNGLFPLLLFLQGTDEQQQGILKIVQTAFAEKNFSLWILRLFSDFLAARSFIQSQLFDLLYTFLEEKGLPKKMYAAAWALSTSPDKLSTAYLANLQTLTEIEEKEPGCARVLTAPPFGIKVFGRYDGDMLIRQYKERDQDKPYGIILGPEFDHDGTFYQGRNMLKELSDELAKEGYLVRISEWGNRKTLVRRLYSFDKKYGGKHKISFGLLGGHGHPEGIKGGPSHRDELTIPHMLNTRTKKLLDEVLTADAPLIFESCSTGVFEGMAHQLAFNTRRTVMAPDRDTALRKVTPHVHDGKIYFKVEAKEGAINVYPIRGSY